MRSRFLRSRPATLALSDGNENDDVWIKVTYPVVPNFEYWRFPHDRLPKLWSSLYIADSTGRVSGNETDGRVAAESQARPKIQKSRTSCQFSVTEWFNNNYMDQLHGPLRHVVQPPPLDRSSTSPDGVHYDTALTACQIVANNVFHGYLATVREGSERVDPDLNHNHLLTKSDY
ncbi:hypothetical protein CIB48_g12231 [Xylaria polymorpha]|nr:hypothetical protein CIB48_g12231 [Xylaria polymorpha]